MPYFSMDQISFCLNCRMSHSGHFCQDFFFLKSVGWFERILVFNGFLSVLSPSTFLDGWNSLKIFL